MTHTADPTVGMTVGLLVLTISLILYLLPALIAHDRRHPQRLAITWLTILAGWTFVGWVGAFVWACVVPRHHDDYRTP